MSNWNNLRLGQMAQLSKDTWKPHDGGEYPYIGLEHIEEGKLRLNGVGNSSSIASNKYYFGENTFLFGKLRPYFRKVVKPKFQGVCSTDIWVVKAKPDFDLDFLFYLFAWQDFVDLSYSGSSGTRMPRADWNFMKDTEWLVPSDITEQKAIAGVLSALDDKIDLLHRQNRTLEALAQTLFRQWFIEEAGDDWEVKPLSEILTVKGGSTPSTKVAEFWNGDVHWTTPRDLSANDSPFLLNTERKITKKGLTKISSGLLPTGTLLLSSRAPVGYLAFAEIPLAINQGFIAIIDNKGFSNWFIYMWLKANMDYVISYANGSTFLEISKTAFKSLEITIPPKDKQQEFDRIASLFFEKIKANVYQIRTLEKLRDLLLPKLMSGEVRVRYDQDH